MIDYKTLTIEQIQDLTDEEIIEDAQVRLDEVSIQKLADGTLRIGVVRYHGAGLHTLRSKRDLLSELGVATQTYDDAIAKAEDALREPVVYIAAA